MDWYLKRNVEVKFDGTAANGADRYTVHVKFTNMLTSDQVASTPQYVLGDRLEGVPEGVSKPRCSSMRRREAV